MKRPEIQSAHSHKGNLWTRFSRPGNGLLWILLVLAIGLAFAQASFPRDWLRLIDWPTLEALAGLLVVTKGIERSGFLQEIARKLLAHFSSHCSLALALVLLSAILAALLTNDVSLFLLVPLTVSLAKVGQLRTKQLVALEALAVNTGSALTPIGNPQNLFLWQSSGLDFAGFIGLTAVPVTLTGGLLFGITLVPLSCSTGAIARRTAPAY
ncbi:SLC13 family permease [Candidatus Methylacidithermus pantelleriae]|uniref:SLC13 family permease n=1 Tax=Candidatus Methylacidithermus pantelleriae TaxID=2744239 RepID=UPI001BD38A44|nr:SLC13 family permease [Candidatus Methylacidithermus pantelleriae]